MVKKSLPKFDLFHERVFKSRISDVKKNLSRESWSRYFDFLKTEEKMLTLLPPKAL